MAAGSQALTRGSLAAAATSSVALAARAGQGSPARARFVWLPRGAETDMRAVTSSVGVA